MTDITELAQSLKAAAEKWSVVDEKYDRAEINVAEFVSAADQYNSIVRDPANILALVEALEKSEKTSEARREAIDRTHNMFVRERDRASAAEEALEKAQQVDEELCRLLPPGAEYMDPPDGGDVTPLEGVRRMVADYRQRIAELESRLNSADKLQDSAFRSGLQHGFSLGQTDDQRGYEQSMAAYSLAAGIKVEAE